MIGPEALWVRFTVTPYPMSPVDEEESMQALLSTLKLLDCGCVRGGWWSSWAKTLKTLIEKSNPVL